MPGLRAHWDARFEVPLADQNIIGAPGESADAEAQVLVQPGDPARSILFARSATTDPTRRMPPLGSSRVDQEYVDLRRAWITDPPRATTP